MISSVDGSYLAGVVLLLHYGAEGELHKAISVMQKRVGDHEKAIREFLMGIRVDCRTTTEKGFEEFCPAFRSSRSDD